MADLVLVFTRDEMNECTFSFLEDGRDLLY